MQSFSDHEVIGFIVQQLGKEYPQPPVPVEAVEKKVDAWRKGGMYPDLSDEAWQKVLLHVKTKVIITMDPGETLSDSGLQIWLPERHADIAWKRWIAYKQLLTQKGFSPGVLNVLDASTDEIVNCLGDPLLDGSWKRRGLVIGDVQSGKTATYLGVVNKAADAGYKLIVLLAGGTEALRKQTQFRVDEGLIGRDSSKSPVGAHLSVTPVFGVGNWLVNFLSAQGLTTQETDFRKTSKQATNLAIDPQASAPYVFVLKKNKTALENLRDWLMGHQLGGAKLDVPMLVVDDESDYASVNTKKEDSPTVINALIRSILGTVTKSSYLAFTATPFANVFIDHETTQELLGDDLFPRDYIRTLDAPSNYIGSRSYFGTEEEVDATRLVKLDDAEDCFPMKHKSHLQVSSLPPSLIDAIRAFVVAVAIREARGDTSARAMLVNVSRFKRVQAQVHELVEAEFHRIKDAIELHSVSLVPGDTHDELTALRRTFERLFSGAELRWNDVVPKLKSAVHSTSVRLINSDRVKQASDISDLESERMIAVGGDVLSRGLTLEGLTISYFHRSVGASDTLLQMARWFGYRPGYDDICRVWLPDDVADQFRYVSGIVDELRAQLRAMKKQGLTPQDFGLMVRMHPETLKITAQNKMGAAEAKSWTVDIAAKRIETTDIDACPETISKNRTAVSSLVRGIESAYPHHSWAGGGGPWPLISGIDKSFVAEFLDAYIPFVTDALFADNVLSSYVEKTSSPALKTWTVAFVSGKGAKVPVSRNLGINAPVRAVKIGAAVTARGGSRSHIPLKVSGRSTRLAGKEDIGRTFGFATASDRVEPRVYEAMMGHGPSLMIYLLEPDFGDSRPEFWPQTGPDGADYLVGVKVAIPGKPGTKGSEVKYLLNSVALDAWRLAVVEETAPEDLGDLDGSDDE
ncbi:Z1 domain-containing protein [Kribbella sp. NPDC049174]|uniref:Z1 domain-containing protein n=1 Tax=Kribbella sp. NPDC049174 TaxID=3364112 RepID=UPI0037148C55